MARRWYDELPAVRQPIAVDDATVHHITWRHGKVITEDHDLEAEQAFVALGGDTCPCLDIVSLFDSPPPLHELLQKRPHWSPSTVRRPPPGLRPNLPPGVSSLPPVVSAEMHRRWQASIEQAERQMAIALLEGDLRDRLLAASAIAEDRRGVEHPHDDQIAVAQHFEQQLKPAVYWSLAGTRRNFAPNREIGFGLKIGREPEVRGRVTRIGGNVEIALPYRWLADVALPGMTLVGNHVVLGVVERSSVGHARVRAITWTRDRRDACEPVLEDLWIECDANCFWYVLGGQPNDLFE